ncbi:hypothetical protein KC19_N007300 [Ceratodon purpureus]|nr:hypothetical protein KC19_N016400 [Ceratodon purpureus]KAG0504145.1 hypothetical protein KC19_N016600 [Ceratodon purpureus]KAG0504198.1 hypothetical protein KC19_N007100 [Ceratodon purpureus]KAG0504200.1 hypothetical protein KC19_N007300 [Ceratodon purpureus]
MLEAALSTSPVVTRLLVGALVRPQKHVSRAPPCRRNMPARALCITISDDRGDESFADDLNMGRGIVSGRVALLLRSTEIRPHRPNDLLPPFLPHTPGCPLSLPPFGTWSFCTWPNYSPTPTLRGATSTTLGALLTLHLDSRDPTVGTPSPSRGGTPCSRRDSLSLPRRDSRRDSPCPCSRRDSPCPCPARVGTRGGTLPVPARVGTRGGTLPVPCSRRDSRRDSPCPLLASGLAAGLSLSLLASGLAAGLSLSLPRRDSRRDSPCPSRAGTRDGTRDSRRESLAIPMSEKDVGVPMTCGSPDDVLESR